MQRCLHSECCPPAEPSLRPPHPVRLRDFIRHRGGTDFTGWIEKKWIDALRLDTSYLIVDDDLAIDGKPISEVDFDRVQECASIAFQRHRAIIWLVKRYPSYSETPVDT